MTGGTERWKPIGVHPKYIIHTITKNSKVQQTINYVAILQTNIQLQTETIQNKKTKQISCNYESTLKNLYTEEQKHYD